ncbi:MAG: hypothetical protein E6684_05985 [Ligilactobacillus animalis]|uniref:hypothetical protein n=1 Tax=Ligilactobacillus animalis TaxID=1605 RepID=UPI002904168F|nr:hypothetical protein [Ligilactobacillus animalis]MDU3187611.1 hypothetical protein [Ligilactobacillus animalis]
MKEAKQKKNIQKVNELLAELYDLLDHQAVKAAVQNAYNKINTSDKVSVQYAEVLKREFSRLSLAKKTKFTRAQEEIVSQLTVFTRRSFQKGFEGLGMVGVWFG